MEDLEKRVNELEKHFAAFSGDLRHAYNYIHRDSASSLTKSRMMMEKLLVEAFTTEMGHEPKRPLLGDMLNDNQFTRRLDRRILTRINSIRDMGNLGPHGEYVESSDAVRVLDDLCVVLDWYLNRYSGRSAPVKKRKTSAGATDSQLRYLFLLGCAVGNRVAIVPVPPGEADGQSLAEFFQTAKRLGLDNNEVIVGITDAVETLTVSDVSELSESVVREKVSQYFDLMVEIPIVIQSQFSAVEYQWFKLGMLIYEVATSAVIDSESEDVSVKATALKSLIESMNLPPTVLGKLDEFSSSVSASGTEELYSAANQIARTLYTLL